MPSSAELNAIISRPVLLVNAAPRCHQLFMIIGQNLSVFQARIQSAETSALPAQTKRTRYNNENRRHQAESCNMQITPKTRSPGSDKP